MYDVILQEELRTVGHSSEHRTRGPALPRPDPFTVIWSSVVYHAVAFWWCPAVINLTLTSGLYRGAFSRTIESSYIGEAIYENEAVGRRRRGR